MSSTLEEQLATQIASAQLPTPVREMKFTEARNWRFDFAWAEPMIAVEVEGATWTGGRHTRGRGFEADCEKYNHAAINGWTVLRVTGAMIRDGRALKTLAVALEEFFLVSH